MVLNCPPVICKALSIKEPSDSRQKKELHTWGGEVKKEGRSDGKVKGKRKGGRNGDTVKREDERGRRWVETGEMGDGRREQGER